MEVFVIPALLGFIIGVLLGAFIGYRIGTVKIDDETPVAPHLEPFYPNESAMKEHLRVQQGQGGPYAGMGQK